MYNTKYTVLLKTLLENEETKPLIQKALSTYPLYERKSTEEFRPSFIPTREQLNQKILNYYKYREIGFETVGRFIEELEISMNEIMPYYNDLLFSADQDFNIIYNVDYKRTTESNKKSESSSEASADDTSENQTKATDKTNMSSTMNDKGHNISSKTPQGKLEIQSDIDNVEYADEVGWNKNNSSSNSNSEANNEATSTNTSKSTNKASGKGAENEIVLETTKGNFGVVSAQDLVSKYRETIINIEQLIINDKRIKELFMLVF